MCVPLLAADDMFICIGQPSVTGTPALPGNNKCNTWRHESNRCVLSTHQINYNSIQGLETNQIYDGMPSIYYLIYALLQAESSLYCCASTRNCKQAHTHIAHTHTHRHTAASSPQNADVREARAGCGWCGGTTQNAPGQTRRASWLAASRPGSVSLRWSDGEHASHPAVLWPSAYRHTRSTVPCVVFLSSSEDGVSSARVRLV